MASTVSKKEIGLVNVNRVKRIVDLPLAVQSIEWTLRREMKRNQNE
jgi:hypothetical protein